MVPSDCNKDIINSTQWQWRRTENFVERSNTGTSNFTQLGLPDALMATSNNRPLTEFSSRRGCLPERIRGNRFDPLDPPQ